MAPEPRLLGPGEAVDVPSRWRIKQHRVLGEGAVSDYVDDIVATPAGEQMHRQYLLHPGAVAVIALDDADRVVVVRQYRHPVGFQLIEPPASTTPSPRCPTATTPSSASAATGSRAARSSGSRSPGCC